MNNMAENETPIFGWERISQVLGVNIRTAYRRREELLRAGVIFYKRIGRAHRKTACAYISLLKAWTIKKSLLGEII